jgi:hypothetical protein
MLHHVSNQCDNAAASTMCFRGQHGHCHPSSALLFDIWRTTRAREQASRYWPVPSQRRSSQAEQPATTASTAEPHPSPVETTFHAALTASRNGQVLTTTGKATPTFPAPLSPTAWLHPKNPTIQIHHQWCNKPIQTPETKSNLIYAYRAPIEPN